MAAMVVLLSLGLLQLAVPGLAQSPPSDTVKVDSFAYGGTGCPSGTTTGIVSNDGQTLTVIYSNYTVITPGSPNDWRKNCLLAVNLIYPAGFTFTLGAVTFRGYAQFEEGVKGALVASYRFQGSPSSTYVSRDLPTPAEGNFEFTDEYASFAYAPCATSVLLSINSEAKVVSPPAPNNDKKGLITVDSTDLKLTQIFGLTWTTC